MKLLLKKQHRFDICEELAEWSVLKKGGALDSFIPEYWATSSMTTQITAEMVHPRDQSPTLSWLHLFTTITGKPHKPCGLIDCISNVGWEMLGIVAAKLLETAEIRVVFGDIPGVLFSPTSLLERQVLEWMIPFACNSFAGLPIPVGQFYLHSWLWWILFLGERLVKCSTSKTYLLIIKNACSSTYHSFVDYFIRRCYLTLLEIISSLDLLMRHYIALFFFRLKSITLIAAGVGSLVNNQELETIAGDRTRVFKVASYDNLDTILSSHWEMSLKMWRMVSDFSILLSAIPEKSAI